MTWCVVRKMESGNWHLVSAVSFATQERAHEHLLFVQASVREGLRSDYRVARLVVVDPAVEHPVPNRPAGPAPLYDWDTE